MKNCEIKVLINDNNIIKIKKELHISFLQIIVIKINFVLGYIKLILMLCSV